MGNARDVIRGRPIETGIGPDVLGGYSGRLSSLRTTRRRLEVYPDEGRPYLSLLPLLA